MRPKTRWTRFLGLHLLLALLSLFFCLPFLWMVSTSLKADDEIIHDPMVWFPELPEKVASSPYLDREAHPAHWERPPSLPRTLEWPAVQLMIRQKINDRAFELFESPDWPLPRERRERNLFNRAGRDIEDSLWEAAGPRMPQDAWKESDRIDTFVSRVKLEDVVHAWQRSYRTLGIGSIYVRNPSVRDIGVSPAPENDRLPYRIVDPSQPILLSERTIPLASPEEKIDQIMVRVRGDASYHRLAVELEAQGKKYRTAEPKFLSEGDYQDVFLKFKPQVPYEVEHLQLVENGASGSGLGNDRVLLRFFLEPTPYTTVIWRRLVKNYREVFHWVPYGTYMWVTVKLTFLNIVGQLLACSLVGFAFARLRFPGRDILFILMLSTMMLPPQVTMVPQFVIFSKLGTYNTLFPLYILSFAGAPFFIFLMRQFYLTIPNDLTDAAKIDGCGFFEIYWRITLPLVKPALAAIAIFQFQATWNEFLQPLIYITDTDKTPISVGLFLFRQAQGVGGVGGNWAELMAASSLMTLPVIFLFFFTQRYFIQGITLTGLKG